MFISDLWKIVREHFVFANIIHPSNRCGLSLGWLNSMISAQGGHYVSPL